jgi:uncharacterized protein (TIGR00297 family)
MWREKSQTLHIIAGVSLLTIPFIGVHVLFIVCFLGIFGSIIAGNWLIPDEKKRGAVYLLVSASILFGTVLLSNAIYSMGIATRPLPLFVAGASLGVVTFGDFILNTLIKESYAKKPKLGKVSTSMIFLGVSISIILVIGEWIIKFTNTHISIDMMIFLSTLGGISASLLGSITPRYMYNLTVPIGSAMVMWLFFDVGYSVPSQHLAMVFLLALGLGYLAHRMRIADLTALFSATLIGVLVISFGNIWWFLLILLFFVVGGGFTKYKYSVKEELGVAEASGGVRGYSNVFSNTLPVLAVAVMYRIFSDMDYALFCAFVGGLSCAIADTLASEIGETSSSPPRLITNLKTVKVGTDGGITFLGEVASLFGSLLIGAVASLFLVAGYVGVEVEWVEVIVVSVMCGMFGSNIDSLLGATMQRRRKIGNSGVNLLATTLSTVLGFVIAVL